MQKKDNKELAILQAAEKMFAERGFKGATTKLIATEAGVTHAMLHYYFRTKEQIFLKVFGLYMDEVWGELKAIMSPDMFDSSLVSRITEICFDFFNRHRGQVSLFLEVSKEHPELLEKYVSEFGRYLEASFSAHRERTEKAVREGRIRSIEFRDLLTDIIVVCASPFILEPLFSESSAMDEKRRKEFLLARKREAVELITGRLRK